MANVVVSTMQTSLRLWLAMLALGRLARIPASYLTARFAKRGLLLNGTLYIYLCIGLGIYNVMLTASTIPLWQHVL